MKKLVLFVAPNTCARVPTIALEEIGCPYETELIRTAAGQQHAPAFRKINPKGKVPTLMIDGTPLTENVAILSWLNAEFPDANLLPKHANSMDMFYQTADLAFFAGTVHPVVTRIAMPMKMIPNAAQSFETVRPKGIEDMRDLLAMIETRLEKHTWWYGENWSVLDGYLFWVWSRITGVGFDGTDFPNILRHCAQCLERPAVQRAMALEASNIEILKSEGNFLAPR